MTAETNSNHPKKPKTPMKVHIRRTIIIVAIVAAVVYVWDEHIKYNVLAKNFDVVEDGAVYRSGKLTPRMLEKVAQQHGIKTVIDFGGYPPDSEERNAILAVDERMNLDRRLLPMIGDGTGDPNMVLEALRIMTDESAQPVLVHCAAGAQRTGIAIVLYDVLVRGVELEEAYQHAFEYGHDPGKNWHLPMYLGMQIEDIEAAFRSGTRIEDSVWKKWIGATSHPDSTGYESASQPTPNEKDETPQPDDG